MTHYAVAVVMGLGGIEERKLVEILEYVLSTWYIIQISGAGIIYSNITLHNDHRPLIPIQTLHLLIAKFPLALPIPNLYVVWNWRGKKERILVSFLFANLCFLGGRVRGCSWY